MSVGLFEQILFWSEKAFVGAVAIGFSIIVIDFSAGEPQSPVILA